MTETLTMTERLAVVWAAFVLVFLFRLVGSVQTIQELLEKLAALEQERRATRGPLYPVISEEDIAEAAESLRHAERRYKESSEADRDQRYEEMISYSKALSYLIAVNARASFGQQDAVQVQADFHHWNRKK